MYYINRDKRNNRNHFNWFSYHNNCAFNHGWNINFNAKSEIIGILQRTVGSKEKTEIGKEKEDVTLVWNSIVSKSLLDGTKITDLILEEGLKNNGNDVMCGYDDENNYLVYFNDTKHTYKIDKDENNITQLENAPSLITETIYVTLYSDGTLAFSNNSETDSTKTITKTYTVGKDDLYTSQDMVPWNNETSNIKKVIFINEIKPMFTKRWFAKCNTLTLIENIENLKTDYVKNMSNMFDECRQLISLDVSQFNTKRVTNMGCMFRACRKLTNLDVGNFDTSNVTNMRDMFCSYSHEEKTYGEGMELTNLNVSRFDTSKVTDFWGMFAGCSKLNSIDVSHFKTIKAENLGNMFGRCYNLTNIDLSNFDTKNVTTMQYMFIGCSDLSNLDLSSFDTSNVINTSEMFSRLFKIAKFRYK